MSQIEVLNVLKVYQSITAVIVINIKSVRTGIAHRMRIAEYGDDKGINPWVGVSCLAICECGLRGPCGRLNVA